MPESKKLTSSILDPSLLINGELNNSYLDHLYKKRKRLFETILQINSTKLTKIADLSSIKKQIEEELAYLEYDLSILPDTFQIMATDTLFYLDSFYTARKKQEYYARIPLQYEFALNIQEVYLVLKNLHVYINHVLQKRSLKAFLHKATKENDKVKNSEYHISNTALHILLNIIDPILSRQNYARFIRAKAEKKEVETITHDIIALNELAFELELEVQEIQHELNIIEQKINILYTNNKHVINYIKIAGKQAAKLNSLQAKLQGVKKDNDSLKEEFLDDALNDDLLNKIQMYIEECEDIITRTQHKILDYLNYSKKFFDEVYRKKLDELILKMTKIDFEIVEYLDDLMSNPRTYVENISKQGKIFNEKIQEAMLILRKIKKMEKQRENMDTVLSKYHTNYYATQDNISSEQIQKRVNALKELYLKQGSDYKRAKQIMNKALEFIYHKFTSIYNKDNIKKELLQTQKDVLFVWASIFISIYNLILSKENNKKELKTILGVFEATVAIFKLALNQTKADNHALQRQLLVIIQNVSQLVNKQPPQVP